MCPHCPRREHNVAGPCPLEQLGSACTLTDSSSPAWAAAAVWRACGYRPGDRVTPEWLPALGGAPPPKATAPRTTSAQVLIDRRQLIWECDYRGEERECGCDRRRYCFLRKGQFHGEEDLVTFSDCLACVAGR